MHETPRNCPKISVALRNVSTGPFPAVPECRAIARVVHPGWGDMHWVTPPPKNATSQWSYTVWIRTEEQNPTQKFILK